MAQLVNYVQYLHPIGQTIFQSLSSARTKTIGKQSQNLKILGKLEIPARTFWGNNDIVSDIP